MIVLDTSVWIEFLKQNPTYDSTINLLLENQQVLAVECVFGELLQGARNKREREIISLYWENLPKSNDDDIWIEAGFFSSKNKLFSKGIGLIDCVILLTARNSHSQVWTFDKKLESLLRKDEIYHFS